MTRRPSLPLFLFLGLAAACDQADCPLDNTVTYTCGFYSGGKLVELNDAITVTALGTDSVLVNQQSGASGLDLPMSYWRDADTLTLTIKGPDYEWKDTLWVRKTNTPHFDSPDCPAKMFHRITAVGSTHTTIDSVTLGNPDVNYANVENIQIHFRAAD